MFEKKISSCMENFIRRGIAVLLCTALILGTFGGLDLAFDLNLVTPKSIEVDAATDTYKNMTNTYLLSIATGTDSGKDDILFIAIDYIVNASNSKMKCTEFIFPSEDSLYKSYEMAATEVANSDGKSTGALISQAKNATGVTLKGIESFKGNAFEAYSSNDFLFTTAYKIDQIERIRVMTKNSGSWSLASMTVFQVDVLYGLRMYGYVSSDYYIDFKGKILASYVPESGSGTLSWNVDRLFFFVTDKSAYKNVATYRLNVVTDDSADTADDVKSSKSTGGAASAGNNLFSDMVDDYNRHTQPKYYFKADIADTYMAGIEEFSSSGMHRLDDLKYSGGYLSEKLLLYIKYQDLFGYNHTLYLPAITSAYLWQLSVAGRYGVNEVMVEGFAQQNDTILFPLELPDCESILECSLTYGEGEKVSGRNWTAPKGAATAFDDNTRTLDLESVQIYRVNSNQTFTPSLAQVKYSRQDANGKTVDVVTNRVEVRVSTNTNPYKYITAADYTGIAFEYNKTHKIDFNTWEMVQPADRVLERKRSYNDVYVVEVTTDEYAGASTIDGAYMKIHYQNNSSVEATSGEIDIKKAAQELYGYWPSDSADLSYINGTTANGKLYFLVHLPGVKNFTGITMYFKDRAEDDWQIKGVKINEIIGMSDRYITAAEANMLYQGKYNTNWNIYREMYPSPNQERRYSTSVVMYLGTQSDERSKTVKATSESVIENPENIEWDKIRYSMSFEEATQGLNYASTRASYTVTVNVDNSIDNGTDDDSGSKNNFYFQLVFEGGSSAYVLANQQLFADGFHPGSQSFKINTNQNYGELIAVNIIPDDVISDKTDPYDKLNVKSIEVSKDTAGGMNVCWVVENIGWVEINYVDNGAKQTGMGANGRTAAEVARSYLVSQKKNSINLQCTISLGDFSKCENNVINSNVLKFDGTLTAQLLYYDTMGTPQTDEFDIVRSIYDYAERKPKYATDGTALSDNSWMLQSNTTDRFIITVQNLSQIIEMRIIAKTPDKAMVLPIKSIAIQMITKESRGMSYGPDGKLIKDNGATELCESNNEGIVEMYLPVNTPQEAAFTFTDHTIKLDEVANTWSSTVSREPLSKNDVINIYIYMRDITGGKVTENGYELGGDIEYVTNLGLTKKLSIAQFNKDESTNMFYAMEQTSPGLTSIRKISLKGFGENNKTGQVDRVVIQQVRSGVVIDSFYFQFTELTGSVAGDVAASASPLDISTVKDEKQKVVFQLGQATETAELAPLGRDIAVAVYYTTKGQSTNNKSYSSKYVFLTDLGITSICPGQVIEVNFNEMNIKDIKGVKFIATGSLKATVGKMIIDRSKRDELGAYKSSEYFNINVTEEKELEKADTMFDVNRDKMGIGKEYTLVPVTVKFKTSDSQVDYESGTDDPITVNLTYAKVNNTEMAEVNYSEIMLGDLQNYISVGSTKTGATAEVMLLIPGVDKLQTMTIKNGSGDPLFGWSIENIRINYHPGGDATQKERLYDRIINQRVSNNNNVVVNFTEVIVDVSTYVSLGGYGDTNDFRKVQNSNSSYLIESGYVVIGDVSVLGSDKGVTVKAEEVDSDGHTADASACLTYTEADGHFIFSPKANDGNSNVNYRITIRSNEAVSKQVVVSVGVKGTGKAQESQNQNTNPAPEQSDTPINWGDDNGETEEGEVTEGTETGEGTGEGEVTEGTETGEGTGEGEVTGEGTEGTETGEGTEEGETADESDSTPINNEGGGISTES